MRHTLCDKLIIITGASSGIGAATARACARAGMDVVLAARRVDKLDAVAEEVRGLGRKALTVACDVTVDADVAALYERAWETFGRIDAVFANAGYGLFGTVMETDLQTHRDIFETNYYGTLRTIREAVPYLKKTDANHPAGDPGPGNPESGNPGAGLSHILICSSVASEIGVPKFGAYCATKAAQDSVAGAMRGELVDQGIVVSSVHPIGTKTEFGERAREFSLHEREAERGSTPKALSQTADHVAKRIVRCLARPRPEVWPSPVSRFAVAAATACPRFGAWVMKRYMRKVSRD
jgi:short-subunit dehydrogenase